MMMKPRLLWVIYISLALWGEVFAQSSIDARSQSALSWLKSEQMEDGSFTAKVITSSPAYNCQMIMLYEYLNIRDLKLPLIKKLVPGILKFQNSDGGISSYPGGPHDQSVTLSCYVALKIAGLSDQDLSSMKAKIVESGGVSASGFTALPFMMLFGFDERVYCVPAWNNSTYVINQDKKLPWVRVVAVPLLFLFQNKKIHQIPSQYAPSLEKRSGCKVKPAEEIMKGEEEFLTWAENHLGQDMTLFDYTPTTIPTLMALSKTKTDFSKILLSIKSLENFFYLDQGNLLMASPGEASVSESGIIARSFLEMGMTSDSPLLQKSLKFILSIQNKENGSFGFSKSNQYFPDPNDTATTLQFLYSMQKDKGTQEFDSSIKKGLSWILTRQNKNGGFGAWDKNSELNHLFNIAYRALKKNGVVVGESIGDDTGRIILALHEMRDYDPQKIDKSVDRAVHWLAHEQEENGSFFGRWFINYGFGTATSLAAMAVRAEKKKIQRGIDRGLSFIRSIQKADGGFSESPLSYYQKQYVTLPESSPAQTGFIIYHLIKMVKFAPQYKDVAAPIILKALRYLKKSQTSDGRWHDPTWTAVSMGNIEFLIYQYLQELLPLMSVIEGEKIYGKLNE
ncbi:MAG: prenyltransferase/squalene oxidase repeat-containing protein [Bacteriovoracaceae bacterium]